jgi:hypothetical protein
MLFVEHARVPAITEARVIGVELAVTAVEQKNVRIEQPRVRNFVQLPINLAKSARDLRSPIVTELAVEDKDRVLHGSCEKSVEEYFSSAGIDRALDVAPPKLKWITAVQDEDEPEGSGRPA